jgi:RecA-family ATPase
MSIVINDSGFGWPVLDIARALDTEPEPLDFVLPGLLAGTVGSLIAPGATGKSFAALELLTQIATGKDMLGLGRQPTGTAVLLAAEDPAGVLHARLRAIRAHLDETEREDLKANALVLPCLGRAGDLLDDGKTADKIERVAQGARLVVLDTLSRWHTGEENERRDAAKVMRALERVAERTGAAIIFLHHTSKAATLEGNGDKQQAGRGSSVFVDEARWVAFLQTMTQDEARTLGRTEEERRSFVRYGVSKANYCPPQPEIWLHREAGGVLVPVELARVEKKAATAKPAKKEVEDYADF